LGALVNQIWSVAGDEDRSDVSQLFLQPFFVYNWKSGAGLGGNFELTQNWKAETTALWFNPVISGVMEPKLTGDGEPWLYFCFLNRKKSGLSETSNEVQLQNFSYPPVSHLPSHLKIPGFRNESLLT